MTLSQSYLSYREEYQALDLALEDDIGIRVEFRTFSHASGWRARAHKARALDRDRNNMVYVPGDVMYGTSRYDCLKLVIRDEGQRTFLYIHKMLPPGKIERMSDLALARPPDPPDQLPLPESRLVQRISHIPPVIRRV